MMLNALSVICIQERLMMEPLLITIAVVILILAVGFGYLYLLYRLRAKRRGIFFEAHKSTFGITVSQYSDEKAYARALRRRLKIKWKGLQKQRVLLKGEPTSVKVSDALKVIAYLDSEAKSGIFIPDLSKMQAGVFIAERHDEDSDAARYWDAEKKIFHSLKERYYTLASELSWPSIRLDDWDGNRFTTAIVSELPENHLVEHDTSIISESLRLAFGRERIIWRVKQTNPRTVQLTALDSKSDEVLAESFTLDIENVMKHIAAAPNDVQFYFGSGVVMNVVSSGGEPTDFTIKIKIDLNEKMLTEENYKRFAVAAAAELDKRWPGLWRTQNKLRDNASIRFKKFPKQD